MVEPKIRRVTKHGVVPVFTEPERVIAEKEGKDIFTIISPGLKGLPPIVKEVPEITVKKGVMPVPSPPGVSPIPSRIQPIDIQDFIYPDSNFVVAASGAVSIYFPSYLHGKHAKYIRMKPSLPIIIQLSISDDITIRQIALEEDKPWYIKGMTFIRMVIDNTANAIDCTIDMLFASKEIEVVQEQALQDAISPDIFTPLTIALAAIAAPVTLNVLYSDLKSVLLISDSTNLNIINIGNIVAQVPTLLPGQSVQMDLRDLRNLYVSGTLGEIMYVQVLRK